MEETRLHNTLIAVPLSPNRFLWDHHFLSDPKFHTVNRPSFKTEAWVQHYCQHQSRTIKELQMIVEFNLAYLTPASFGRHLSQQKDLHKSPYFLERFYPNQALLFRRNFWFMSWGHCFHVWLGILLAPTNLLFHRCRFGAGICPWMKDQWSPLSRCRKIRRLDRKWLQLVGKC